MSEHTPAGLALLALLGLGGWMSAEALAQVEVPAGTPVADGSYTTAVERAYKAQLAWRDPALRWWTWAQYRAFGEGRPGLRVGEGGWLFSEEELACARPEQQAAVVEHVGAVASRLGAAGVTLVVALVPSKARIYEDRLGQDLLGGGLPPEPRGRYGALRGALRAQGLLVPDLQAPLRAARSEGESFVRTDSHWSPLGARRAAEALAAALPEGVRPALGQAPAELLPGVVQQHTGDLLRFLPLPDPAAEGLGPEVVAPYTLRTQGGGLGLLDEARPPVVLVGTSFSAQAQWGFADALRAALDAEVLEVAQEGGDPFTPMRRWLDSPGALSPAPALVVWELPERAVAAWDEGAP